MERTILFHLVTEQSSFGDTLLRYCGQGQVYPYLLLPSAFLPIIKTLESPPIVNSGNRAQSLV